MSDAPSYGNVVAPRQESYIGDTVFGKQVGTGWETNVLGTFHEGRPATEANIAAAGRRLIQVEAKDFAWLEPGSVYDRASGQAYQVLDSDPLFLDDPTEVAELFFPLEGVIHFLHKREGVTLETIESERERAAHEAEGAAEKGRRFRAKQSKRVVTMAEVYNAERFDVTLREAARRVLEASGEIAEGPHGELVVKLPERLGDEPMLERDARRPLLTAGEVLVAGHRVVLAALRDGGKRGLLEKLPDEVVTLGGGIA